MADAGRDSQAWTEVVGPSLLALLNVLTLLIAGTLLDGGGDLGDILRAPSLLQHGVGYALGLSVVLATHELAQQVVARAVGLSVSPPYMLPAPTFLGSLGGLTLLRDAAQNRRQLFDVAVAGPLAGAAVALPMLVLGIAWSDVADASQVTPLFGQPWLVEWLVQTLKPEAVDVGLRFHPLALAGWSGLLITVINLMPVGQLDGGHLCFAIFGRLQPFISAFCMAGLITLGMWYQSPVWIVWVLIVLVLGYKHPPVVESESGLPWTRYLAAAVTVALFVVSFTVHPTGVPGPRQ